MRVLAHDHSAIDGRCGLGEQAIWQLQIPKRASARGRRSSRRVLRPVVVERSLGPCVALAALVPPEGTQLDQFLTPFGERVYHVAGERIVHVNLDFFDGRVRRSAVQGFEH